ncbi:hypothetical protein J6W91_01000 [Candidatus Saccharibacteria bacterium]|nr:hypothetical protein [Candidatus Saccharibacteria bacterium]
MDPNQNTEVNPAAAVADAAMNGATPVVTTTDLNAADVAPEPTLQAPVLDPNALATPGAVAPDPGLAAPGVVAPDPGFAAPGAVAPEAPAEDTGPVSLAPSADFQMGEVSTVSAVQNGADGNLAASADDVMVGQPLEEPTSDPSVDQLANSEMGENGTTGQEAADFNDPEAAAAAEAAAAEKNSKDEEDDEPIVAAAPVPGSIGSAKSYADIQRAEAEKAAKAAAKQGKGGMKLSKNMILGIVIGAIALIGIAVGIFVITAGNSKPTETITLTAYVDPGGDEEHDLSTLSCKRTLAPEEYSSYGAVAGTQENIFYFKDDTLDGLTTNFAYTYANQALTNFWRDKLASDYGVTPNAEEDEEAEDEGDEEGEDAEEPETATNDKKTTAEMLHHYVTTSGFTVTHGMEIKSEDIKDWLESDAYSDVTYGASENATPSEDGEEEEIVRNLEYYRGLQNKIDYTCTVTKGY